MMRKFINIITEAARPRDPRSNPAFIKWFEGSKVLNADGSPLIMYHGTSQDFEAFDPKKIKANETDAPFNGFWFSSDHDTSPAFHGPTNIMPVYLSIKNPAPWQVWRKVTQQVHEDMHETGSLPERSRTTCDEVRYKLIEMGYDGIIFNQQPDIDAEALERDGRVDFRCVRGNKYWLQKTKVPELVWGKQTMKYDEIVVKVYDENGKEVEGVKMNAHNILDYIAIYGIDKCDLSQFNFVEKVGTIVLDNGRKIVAHKEEREHEHEGPVHTGNEVDQLDYYCDYIGHVTGYDDLQDFIDSHKEATWVCFHPNQIKSVYNRGTWSAASNNITESSS